MYIKCINRAIYKRAFKICHFRPPKKIEIFSFSLLHIRTAFDRLAAFPRKRGHRSLTSTSRKDNRLDALTARWCMTKQRCRLRQGVKRAEEGIWWTGVYRQPYQGMIKLGNSSLRAFGFWELRRYIGGRWISVNNWYLMPRRTTISATSRKWKAQNTINAIWAGYMNES